MRYIVESLKNLLITALTMATVTVSFYSAIILFLYLLLHDALQGPDAKLEEDIKSIQNKIERIPDVAKNFLKGGNQEKQLDVLKGIS